MRLILDVKFDNNHIPLTSTNKTYKELNILKFSDVYEYNLIKFIYSLFYTFNQDLFVTYFSHLLPLHNYNTRNNIINLPMVRTECGRQCTVYKCAQLMNCVSAEYFKFGSINAFKYNYKRKKISSY